MKAEVYEGGVVMVESGTPTEAAAMIAVPQLGPFVAKWSGEGFSLDDGLTAKLEFRPQGESSGDEIVATLTKELEAARFHESSLRLEVANLKRQVEAGTHMLDNAITQRDAARLFADDEIAARVEAEKERDNLKGTIRALKDQLGMDPSERFTLQDKWHNEKERRQAAEMQAATLLSLCTESVDEIADLRRKAKKVLGTVLDRLTPWTHKVSDE